MLTRDLIIDIATDLKKIANSEKRSRFDALQIKPQPKQCAERPEKKNCNRRTDDLPKEEKGHERTYTRALARPLGDRC